MPPSQFERRQAAAPIAISIAEACRLSGIGRTRIYEAIQAHEIDSIKIGRRRLIILDSLRRFLHVRPAGDDVDAA